MSFAPHGEEEIRAYISWRIPKLKQQQIYFARVRVLGIALSAFIIFRDGIAAGLAFVLVIELAYAAAKGVTNAHVDLLYAFWRDLDRDEATDLQGFETAI